MAIYQDNEENKWRRRVISLMVADMIISPSGEPALSPTFRINDDRLTMQGVARRRRTQFVGFRVLTQLVIVKPIVTRTDTHRTVLNNNNRFAYRIQLTIPCWARSCSPRVSLFTGGTNFVSSFHLHPFYYLSGSCLNSTADFTFEPVFSLSN